MSDAAAKLGDVDAGEIEGAWYPAVFGGEYPFQEFLGAKLSTAVLLRQLDPALECEFGGGAERRLLRPGGSVLILLGTESDRRQAVALLCDQCFGKLLAIKTEGLQLGACRQSEEEVLCLNGRLTGGPRVVDCGLNRSARVGGESFEHGSASLVMVDCEAPRMLLVHCLAGDAQGFGDLGPGPAIVDGAADGRVLDTIGEAP